MELEWKNTLLKTIENSRRKRRHLILERLFSNCMTFFSCYVSYYLICQVAPTAAEYN